MLEEVYEEEPVYNYKQTTSQVVKPHQQAENIQQQTVSLLLEDKIENNTELYLVSVLQKILMVYNHNGKSYLPGSLLSAITDALHGITIQDKLMQSADGKRDLSMINDFYLYGVSKDYIDKALKALSKNESKSTFGQEIEVIPKYIDVKPEQEALLKENDDYYLSRMTGLLSIENKQYLDAFLSIEKSIHNIPQDKFYTDEIAAKLNKARNIFASATASSQEKIIRYLINSAIDEEEKTRNYNPNTKRL